ncbi:uncharacterized [Tachysurus ichikawai]
MVDIFGFNSKLSNKRVTANGSDLHRSSIHTNHDTDGYKRARAFDNEDGRRAFNKSHADSDVMGRGPACGKVQAAGGGATHGG